MKPFTSVLAIITATPASIPAIGPARIAAEIVALVAHNVVGHDWLSNAHWSDATNSVDRISATTTTISAATQDTRLPNPSKYAKAHNALHARSTANSVQPIAGRSSSPFTAI